MKSLIAIIFVFFSSCILYAQEIDFPLIKKEGKIANDLVPKNWVIISEKTGDLNKDDVDDLVLVIQSTYKNNIIFNDGLGVDSLDTNPRILLILFKDTITDLYKLIEQSTEFILRHEEPTMTDPFSGIDIERGILIINFHIWYNAGSWYDSNHSYKFRYQGKEFKLIGAENSSFHRETGDSEWHSFNFLTKKYCKSISNVFDEKSTNKETWSKIEMKELKTLNTFKNHLH